MSKKLAFIGAGNMASALINGLLTDGYPANNIIASDQLAEKRENLAGSGIHTTDNNCQAVTEADVVILAVKPQVLQAVCEEIQPAVQQNKPLVISIAAGVSETSIDQWLGKGVAIVRTMPNTPAMVQTGATVLHANARVSDKQKDLAESILRAVGITRWLDKEALIDVATAVSGSGPAYYFLLMETMEQAAIELGLPEETAHLLTLQTALGAARMAIESHDLPSELRNKVTSPGGTTEAAINHMIDNQLPDTINQAMRKARDRAVELAQNTAK
jgi:pyrroline-5-carboxylate reductase